MMKTGKVIVLGLAGVLAANLLFTYVLTRPSGAALRAMHRPLQQCEKFTHPPNEHSVR